MVYPDFSIVTPFFVRLPAFKSEKYLFPFSYIFKSDPLDLDPLQIAMDPIDYYWRVYYG